MQFQKHILFRQERILGKGVKNTLASDLTLCIRSIEGHGQQVMGD